ncbi:hypothetical protein DL96DRAFT_1621348 [Flagelloscypha sp. PMI_526]|nr:hypothetical protein DL96DRAFT_1621348 [Flagelloscypha sp. PMI_526]
MTAEPSESLPAEILDDIIVFAADSGGLATTLQLCVVSQSFHQRSAVKRLYHTLYNIIPSRLGYVIHTSVLLRASLASWVRVLIMQSCPRDLLNEALTLFTGLRALGLSFSVVIEPARSLPYLQRYLHFLSSNIPLSIAQNLTHLYSFGDAYKLISQAVQTTGGFGRLTHLLVYDWPSGSDVALARVVDLLHQSLPHRFSDTLEVFILSFPHLSYHHLRSSPKAQHMIQAIQEVDDRVIFWNQQRDDAPARWKGPWLFIDYRDSEGSLINEALGLLPDGTDGIWEIAEWWIEQERAKKKTGVRCTRTPKED